MNDQITVHLEPVKFKNLNRQVGDSLRRVRTRSIVIDDTKRIRINATKKELIESSQEMRRKVFEEDKKIKAFYKWFMDLRKKSGLSDVQFAKRTGISRRTIDNIKFKRGHIPRNGTINKLRAFERLLVVNIKSKRSEK